MIADANVCLPFSEDPMLLSYQYLAFPMSIIEANTAENTKEILPWCFGRYVNCCFTVSDERHQFKNAVTDSWGIAEGVLLENIETYHYENGPEGLKQAVCSAVQNRCYISMEINEKYIPGTKGYQTRTFFHDTLISGFNLQRNTVRLAGFDVKNRYRVFEVPFSDLFLACFDDGGRKSVAVHLLTYNQSFRFPSSQQKIIAGITDYLESSNREYSCPESCYGVTAIGELVALFENNARMHHPCSIDIRYTKSYEELKTMISKSILYLSAQIPIVLSDSIRKEVMAIQTNAQIVHRMALKWNISDSDELVSQIAEKMYRDTEKEKTVLEDFLSQISSDYSVIPQ